MREFELAADGILARRAGEYAREKLAFLEAFIPPALSIAGSMPDRTYLDLFAGPGRNITKTGTEFPGSPMIGIEARATAKHQRGFSRAHLVNYRREAAEALHQRIESSIASGRVQVPRAAVHEHRGDANVLLPSILETLPKRGYILAFADITGLKHWPWESVEALKAQGHSAVDLYVLFPLEMTIDRLLGINRARADVYAGHLDRFFGERSWRAHYDARTTSSQGATFRTQLIELYQRRLMTRWKHAVVACAPGFSEDRALYRMFFATNDEAALKAAKWARARKPGAQLSLLD